MRTVQGVFTFVLTVAAAVAIGFGIPLGWVWIGSQLQGDEGASSVSWTVAMVILFGIIFTYVALLYLASLAMGYLEDRAGQPNAGAARSPWMRGMSETRQPERAGLAAIERVFVVTTLLVTVAFWLWFAFLAGSPIPSQ